ncbi:hypothetical protein HPB48_002074 [Haemaphysalis longicornis]|uniref:TOG domain-containing protein n=1 Tax=Haemaphysalis longicornis TaxID=44386 RepID=A0A9J6FI41_HAELO|nr:hypothetical protein HPB48_002074 [Haemaphysalis longicornis]
MSRKVEESFVTVTGCDMNAVLQESFSQYSLQRTILPAGEKHSGVAGDLCHRTAAVRTAAAKPAGATWYRDTPHPHGGVTSDQVPGSAPERNNAELDLCQLHVPLMALTEGQRTWPRSVNSGADSVLDARSAERNDRRSDDDYAFRGSARPTPSVRPMNLGRGRSQRGSEQENMASSAGPGQDWSAVKKESAWTDSSCGRFSPCSAGISSQSPNSSVESRGRARRRHELAQQLLAAGRPVGAAPMDVPSIVKHLSSIHWSDRKEGLLGLLSVRRSGRTLSLPDLKKVTDMFTKMFMDPHTKVFTPFLEALGELIHVHHSDLHSWLYVLLTRLFMKTGTDLLSSLQTKIQKILSIIRDSFPHAEQFQAVVRYITDPAQTPNIKVKITVLRYLMALLQAMDSGDMLVNTPETQSMIAKIFSWIRDQKSAELRRHSQEVIVSIFKLRPADMHVLLNKLDPENQTLAMNLIQSYMRARNDESELRTPSPITTYTHSPITSTPNSRRAGGSGGSRSSTPLQRSLEEEEDNTENMKPEEVYSSLVEAHHGPDPQAGAGARPRRVRGAPRGLAGGRAVAAAAARGRRPPPEAGRPELGGALRRL